MTRSIRFRVWRVLGRTESRRWVQGAADALVLSALVALLLGVLVLSGTAVGLSSESARELWTLAAAAFTVEYALRLWSTPEGSADARAGPWRARHAYARSPLGLFDVGAFLPCWLTLAGAVPSPLGEMVSLVALCKLARFAPALQALASVISGESRTLGATLVIFAILVVLDSGAIFLLERGAQPKLFTSLSASMWWTFLTMITGGYGGLNPVTVGGRMMGALTILLGVGVVAVPVGIIATGFYREMQRRDFIVTWQTIADIPLFKGLDAGRIAGIARLLKPRVVPPRHVVVRRGEPADAMYIILAGEIQVDIGSSPVRLSQGQYFGEIGLLRDALRTATVTTLTECNLLVLEVADFRRLIAAHPEIKASVERMAESRMRALEDGGPRG
ncbi:MAG: ion transporter, partial [Alphaproteobacteria bacterium]